MERAAVAVYAAVVAVVVLLWAMGSGIVRVSRVSGVESLYTVVRAPVPGRVVEVFLEGGGARYSCALEVNRTHVLYGCWAARCATIVLDNGTAIGPPELRQLFGRCEVVNHTVIEVADLVNRSLAVHHVYDLTPLGLGVFRRVVERGRFEYRVVSLRWYPGVGILQRLYSPSDNAIRVPIAVLTFGEPRCNETVCLYPYRPAPRGVAERYARAGEGLWCRVVEEMLGLECSFVVVDPAQHCSWPEAVAMPGTPRCPVFPPRPGRLGFRCRPLGELSVLPVIEVPCRVWCGYRLGAGCYYGPHVLVRAGRLGTFLHEVGHALGLGDLYDRDRSRWPPWAAQLVRVSIMWGSGRAAVVEVAYRTYAERWWGLGLADALRLLHNVYYLVKRCSPEVAERIREKLLGYGYSPPNLSLVLPLDESERIPPPFSTVIEQGVAWYERSEEGRLVPVFNHDVPRLLRAIARAAREHGAEAAG